MLAHTKTSARIFGREYSSVGTRKAPNALQNVTAVATEPAFGGTPAVEWSAMFWGAQSSGSVDLLGCGQPAVAVQWTYSIRRSMMETTSRRRSRRMDLRTTPEERELIDRAVVAAGTDLTDFVVTHAYEAALRVLADRDRFELDRKSLKEWEAINARPARELPGLRGLMQRRSPFSE